MDVLLILLAVMGALSGALSRPSALPQPAITYAPVALPVRWVQGFSRAVSGEVLVYPWAYPGQTRALLTRTTDGQMQIEWEAEPPPPGPDAEAVSLLWHAGTASGYGAHRFTLALNGRPLATFTSGRDTADRDWTVAGSDGATLAFKTTRVGTFNELFGFMVLTVPRRLLGPGPPRLSVVGEAAGSQDYYMAFQEPVRAWSRGVAEQARFRDGRPVLRVELSRIADAAPLRVRSGGQTLWSGTAQPGYTGVLVPAPSGALGQIVLALEINGREEPPLTVTVAPVRRWAVHLLPHSHVDIGYSDPQPEVEKKQWKNLGDAVALAARTASYPPEARFRWNVEGLWSVESYLKQAGADERAAFVEAVKAGSIGLQANYANILTGLCSPEELAHWTDAARRLQAQYGLPPMRSAMHTDIPGLSWTVVTALAQAGVRYFSSGPNYMPGLPDRGDRIGHTLSALGDRPFWWVSPSGADRVLFWMAGRGYSWFHGLNMGQVSVSGQQPFLEYLSELVRSDYPYELVQVRYTIGGDNGPVDAGLPDFVRTWNETFEVPRLIIDTAESLFAEFEQRYGGSLLVLAGDMTPYWEDGALSTAAEEALVRASVRRLQRAESLFALRKPADFPGDVALEAWRHVLLWHEHTWGAAASVSAPDRRDVIDQWEYKRAFAVEADRQSRALMDAARPTPGPALEVINLLSWQRGGLVLLPKVLSAAGDRVRDGSGRVLPSQRLASGMLAVQVSHVPALGSVRLSVAPGQPVPPAEPVQVVGQTLDNGRVRVAVDATGAIASLRWVGAPGQDLAGEGGLNRYLYVAGRDPHNARGVVSAQVTTEDAGPLLATLRIESEAAGVRRLLRRVSLAAGSDTVDIENTLEKIAVRSKESAHMAFPFAVDGGVFRADEGGAVVTIERDQLPGSCRDFIGVHSAIDVSNNLRGVALLSLDAPVIELAALTDERPSAGNQRAWRAHVPPGTAVYAYLLNNYWHTNYKADQEGLMTFRFAIWPHGPFDPAALRRFGADGEQPLLVVATDAAAPPTRAPFRIDGSGVVVQSLAPAGTGRAILARLYNASDRQRTAAVIATAAAPALRVALADAAGRPVRALNGPLVLPPFAAVRIHIEPVAASPHRK